MTNTTERRRMQNRIAQRNHRTSLPTFLCACVYMHVCGVDTRIHTGLAEHDVLILV